MKNYRHLVMIYRDEYRRLDDGCDSCSKSQTYCDARADLRDQPCCTSCSHKTAE